MPDRIGIGILLQEGVAFQMGGRSKNVIDRIIHFILRNKFDPQNGKAPVMNRDLASALATTFCVLALSATSVLAQGTHNPSTYRPPTGPSDSEILQKSQERAQKKQEAAAEAQRKYLELDKLHDKFDAESKRKSEEWRAQRAKEQQEREEREKKWSEQQLSEEKQQKLRDQAEDRLRKMEKERLQSEANEFLNSKEASDIFSTLNDMLELRLQDSSSD
ncbi:MAG: hypothetical protein ACRD3W_16365 [Terriglobales bacterium]